MYETSEKIWWYDGRKIIFRSPSSTLILKAISENPDITIDNIATAAGIVPRAVKNQLRLMTKNGYIQRSDADGSWHIFATQSI